MASARTDLLSQPYIDALVALQDSVRGTHRMGSLLTFRAEQRLAHKPTVRVTRHSTLRPVWQVPTISSERVAAIVNEELGASMESVFDTFEVRFRVRVSFRFRVRSP